MSRRNWVNFFSRGQGFDLTNDLERGYESALLIQNLELEFYGDRLVRSDVELGVPKSVQASILRRFRAALLICRTTLESVERNRGQFDLQELRQLQLIEAVVSRYGYQLPSGGSPAISRAPEALPRSLLGFFDTVRRQLDPASEETVVAGFRRRRNSTLISLRILLL